MKGMRRTVSCAVVGLWTALAVETAPAAEAEACGAKVDLKFVGTLQGVGTRVNRGQPWMLGCETLDRDFTDFDQYKDYIVPLGIKEIRHSRGISFIRVPVYDSPCVLTERAALDLM